MPSVAGASHISYDPQTSLSHRIPEIQGNRPIDRLRRPSDGGVQRKDLPDTGDVPKDSMSNAMPVEGAKKNG